MPNSFSSFVTLRSTAASALALVALFIAVAITAGCGRSDLADYVVAQGDGGPGDDVTGDDSSPDGDDASDAGSCSPFNCPFGCCDTFGNCQPGFSTQSCGTGGFSCQNCLSEGFNICDPASHMCMIETPGCGPTNCKGCCVGDMCVAGDQSTACGVAGEGCFNCTVDGQVCSGGSCTQPTCGPTTCSGCCFGNLCEPGALPTACGSRGQQCINCQNLGETCGTAGTGGMCIPQTGCGPGSCSGCCDGNTCLSGIAENFCGSAGQQCQNCALSGEVCSAPGGFCSPTTTCGPGNCSGCCEGNVCITGNSNTACGVFGQQCQDCQSFGEQCQQTPMVGGFCTNVPTCGPGNCSGCCQGNACLPGTGTNQCGEFGQQCRDCAPSGETCTPGPVGGTCTVQPTCGPGNCPGCCQGTTCLPGTGASSCGLFGQACADCSLFEETCNAVGQCVPVTPKCDATSCPAGCCDTSGTCQGGFLDNLCGDNGMSCQNCLAIGSTCDVNVTPRTCVSEQMQCPSQYGGCNPSLMEQGPPFEKVCPAADLQNAAAACASGAQSVGCQAFFSFEEQQRPGCAACLQPFDYDFSASLGIINCVTPYLSSTCNHELACFVDCAGSTCAQCPDQASMQQCQNGAGQAQCSSFSSGAACATQALFGGPGSFCAPVGNFGSWLQTVGTQYCLQ